MSVSSGGGSSTPRGSMTPPPPMGSEGGVGGSGASSTSAAPSPLTVGTRFVKQYYKVLSTTPDQIFRFYQPTSVLSRGIGSDPATQPTAFQGMDKQGLASRFTHDGYEGCPVQFVFENGAIDAQVSMNDGVLLTVTGHVVYHAKKEGGSEGKDKNPTSSAARTKAFVHTIFLGSIVTTGTKRSYYVHNDILRFLSDDGVGTAPPPEERISAPAVGEKNKKKDKEVAGVGKVPVPEKNKKKKTSDKDEAPGGGVEESKESLLVEDEEDGRHNKNKQQAIHKINNNKKKEEKTATDGLVKLGLAGAAGSNKSNAAISSEATKKEQGEEEVEENNNKKSTSKPVGSWASLVSGTPATPTRAGAGGAAATPGRGGGDAKGASSPHTPKTPKAAGASSAAVRAGGSSQATGGTSRRGGYGGSGTQQQQQHQHHQQGGSKLRDPDSTLVIKNLIVNAKEADVRGVFEAYAEKTNTKILGITIPAHRQIGFVDYSSPAPVLAAVEQHKKVPFELNGRVLELYQKSVDMKARRQQQQQQQGGGSFRSGGGGGGQHQQQSRSGGYHRRSGRGGGGGGGGRGK